MSGVFGIETIDEVLLPKLMQKVGTLLCLKRDILGRTGSKNIPPINSIYKETFKTQYEKFARGLWHSAETFGFLASPSARSYNSGHTATLRSAQIRLRRTSYVRKTLYEIAHE